MRALIRELLEIQIGYQCRDNSEISQEGTYHLIQAKDVDSELGHDLVVPSLDLIKPARNPAPYIVENGDLLFLARGRRRSATLVEGLPSDRPSIAMYYFFILRPKSNSINPGFVAWIINQGPAKDYLANVAGGTTIPFVTKQAFSALEIDLPGLEVQEYISRMYRLSMREMQLLRHLEQKRMELVRSACLELYGQSGRE